MKHLFKRTVVLLNNFENIDILLKKAIDFSIQHDSTVEILYVQEEALFDTPNYFLSEEQINNEELDKKLVKAKIQEHLHELNIQDKHSILVYEDDTVDQILHYAKEEKNILFITAYHHELSENLIKKTPYSFWIIKNSTEDYNNIAIPLDFSEDGKTIVHASKHIFSQSSITMIHDYRYLLDSLTSQVDYLNVIPIITPDIIEFNEKLKIEQKQKFENYKKEFDLKGVCIEGTGALDEDLIRYISHRDFDLTIMYHQDSELFLSPSLILELLKKLQTDFFIFNTL